MMQWIPRHQNSVINYELGDGFKSQVLPCILHRLDLIIVRDEAQVNKYMRICDAAVITLHRAHKLDPKTLDYKRVIIDVRLPRCGTRAAGALKRICKGKTVSIVERLHDPKALSSALFVMSEAKTHHLKVVNFNMFQHRRYG